MDGGTKRRSLYEKINVKIKKIGRQMMKLSKQQLKRIIKEELEHVLGESNLLNRYAKSKEEEFRKYLQDKGKDPDKIINALGPAQADVMRQSLINNYPTSMNVPGAPKSVQGGEMVMELIKTMSERQKPPGLHAELTGQIEKRDYGSFGTVGYDVEFKWPDGKVTTKSLMQLGNTIVISGLKGRHTIEDAIDLIDSQKILDFDY
jgi:hypothetical protein